MKKLPEAIKHITLAESITTNCPYTYYVKSIYTYQKDDIESAIRYTQQAIKLQSKEGLFYIMLGDLLYKQFNLELATTYWKKATEGMDLAHLEQQRFRIKHMNKNKYRILDISRISILSIKHVF